jgi:hypothetical protein
MNVIQVAGTVTRLGYHGIVRSLFVYGCSGRRVANPGRRRGPSPRGSAKAGLNPVARTPLLFATSATPPDSARPPICLGRSIAPRGKKQAERTYASRQN